MNFEHSDMAAWSLGGYLAYMLSTPKVKEFIPPQIRYFILGGLWVLAALVLFRIFGGLRFSAGWEKVYEWFVFLCVLVVGVFVVILGILVIAIKIFASIRKKSTDDAIDP